MSVTRLQKLEVKREALAAMQVQQVRDRVRLGAAFVGKGDRSVNSQASSSTTSVADGPVIAQLTDQIAAQEVQVGQLQQEKGWVSAQLVQCEEELQRTLCRQANPCAEPHRAETPLAKSEMTFRM
ncbi:hypothetical protein JKF63_06814 [Porcisia hertigi]|uniref:Uncharacterized protein n=1 Tax=Porcisia hertigi TaxID=2761500 RepID=A0A836LJ62_9TRYP|nr:hypothetical protein JKF63_06814 [Porcisia hertigi]